MSDHVEFGVPITLLHESDGFTVTIELKNGEIYRGILEGSEDNMNCELKDVTYTNLDGVDTHLDSVYIRGSSVLFVVVPDMLANSPMFIDRKEVRGNGYGYAGNLRDRSYASTIRNRFY